MYIYIYEYEKSLYMFEEAVAEDDRGLRNGCRDMDSQGMK